MKRIENKTITSYKGPWWPRTVGNVELIGCTFRGCSIGFRRSKDFSRRTIVRNVHMRNCKISTCLLGPAQLEEITVENVQGDDLFVWGALFKHVRMVGKFDTIVIHGIVTTNWVSERDQLERYWLLCNEYYVDCDWALDIREAQFADFSIRTRGVPAHLVRRDPETQAVVTKQRIIEGKWRSLELGKLVQTHFRLWENEGGEDLIIVAPKAMKSDFIEVMADIRRLREAGIAEPN
jgi:hypothetical protein